MRIPAAVALAVAAATMVSAAPVPDSMQAFTCANALLNRGEYLKATDLLSSAMAQEKDSFGMLHQFSTQVTPFLTGEPPASAMADIGKGDAEDLDKLARADLHDALGEIVERARHTNVVILNEEHDVPRDRAFALEVARALRPLGYSNLAAESFASSADPAERAEKAKALANDGYARLHSGLYTKDPVFGDFVRQALAMGYRPIAYEYVLPKGAPQPADQVATRDQGEADNLVAELLGKNPTAKVLIYVGYSHAAEAPVAGGEWMAARLKRMTGIDPLTIDQTTLSPTAFGTGIRALYAALKPRLHGGSVVPVLDGKPLIVGPFANAVDLQVAHAPERLVNGRPDWLLAMGRTPKAVPSNLRPRTGKALVQAFVDGEADDAIPVDQLVVAAGRTPPPLLVPKGPVHLKVRSGYQPGDCDGPPKA